MSVGHSVHLQFRLKICRALVDVAICAHTPSFENHLILVMCTALTLVMCTHFIQFEDLTYSVSVPVKKLSMVDRIKGLSLSGFPRTEKLDKILLKDVTGTIRVCPAGVLCG